MAAVLRRLRSTLSCLAPASRRGALRSGTAAAAAPQAGNEAAVQAVLRSRSWLEALGLQPGGPNSGEPPAASGAGGAGGAGDAEASGAAEVLTDDAVLHAFLFVGAEVHPFRGGGSDAEAQLALRWAADAFVNLRGREQRQQSASVRWPGPLREEVCATTGDRALQLFSEAVVAVHSHLSLHNEARGGLDRRMADALLQGMHLLHLTPNARDRPSSQQRSLMDSVLYGTQVANWLVSTVIRITSFRSDVERSQRERLCSTTIAALGGVAFAGAARMQRMMVSDAAASFAAGGDQIAMALEPQVRCPLCRTCSPAARAIRNVHAGEGMPACCICTEHSANVVLMCGHLCLCDDCFQRMPRTTEAAG